MRSVRRLRYGFNNVVIPVSFHAIPNRISLDGERVNKQPSISSQKLLTLRLHVRIVCSSISGQLGSFNCLFLASGNSHGKARIKLFRHQDFDTGPRHGAQHVLFPVFSSPRLNTSSRKLRFPRGEENTAFPSGRDHTRRGGSEGIRGTG